MEACSGNQARRRGLDLVQGPRAVHRMESVCGNLPQAGVADILVRA